MEKPIMPLIQLNLMDQVSTPTKKKEIVSKLTAAVAPFEGETMRPVTWVSIEEIWSLEWSIGGPAMTTGAVPDFVAGKK
jgi:phenylpyruvate tautomerase PptA (4-oxalocrotonate tautomerase family)